MPIDRREQLNNLVTAVAQGYADCLDGIYYAAGGQMFAVAQGIVRDRAIAEDIVHDSLIKIAKYAHKYKKGTSALAWIMTIVRNTALDSLRKRKKEISADELYSLSSSDYLPEARENAIALEGAIAKLNEIERKIIYCRYYLDMTVRETAAQLKMSKSAVQRYQENAENKIKMILSGTDGSPHSL
ncbi:MAG: sigma-70 family RNA polymerase sigma factor [Clostridiales bacterium]|nr:sigma-70 family RNA polymerase sigma factor [Clostridiales bacterium]